MIRKRLFDLFFSILTFPIWSIVLTITTIILFFSPQKHIFYRSERLVYKKEKSEIFKFCSMDPDLVKKYMKRKKFKEEIDTGFISLDPQSGVYTKIGIILEKFKLVELPELLLVLKGKLSLVGNRPLPYDLQFKLENKYYIAEKRLDTKAGVFGVIQMLGRQVVSPKERLKLECNYCSIQSRKYNAKLDFLIIIISLLKIFNFQIIRDKNDVNKILNDKSFKTIGHLIIANTIASKPIK